MSTRLRIGTFVFLNLLFQFFCFLCYAQIPARQVVVNGQKYRVYYNWTNPENASRLKTLGSYNEQAYQSDLHYASSGKTGNITDPGLNICSNPVESAEFGGRAGSEGISPHAQLLEVLVPESEVSKIEYNDVGEKIRGTKSWYQARQGIKGSVIREFTGVGMTAEEIAALPEKIQADEEVQWRLKKQFNPKLVEAGKAPLENHPSASYMEKRIVELENAPKTSSAKSAACGISPTNLLGKAGNTLGLVSIAMALVFKELNPYYDKNSDIPDGVSCRDAEKNLGVMKCEWQSLFNNDARCSIVAEIAKQNRKIDGQEVCSVRYKEVIFNVPNGADRDFLEKTEYWNGKKKFSPNMKMDTIIKILKAGVHSIKDQRYNEGWFPPPKEGQYDA